MSAVSANGCFKHDDSMEKTGLFYARYMDDWVVIAPTRWKLRSAIRIVNRTLNLRGHEYWAMNTLNLGKIPSKDTVP